MKRNIESWLRYRERVEKYRIRQEKAALGIGMVDVGTQADLLERWRAMRYMRNIARVRRVADAFKKQKQLWV